MKKILKKSLAIIMAAFSIFAVACDNPGNGGGGDGNTGNGGAAKKIVIYAGGSSEFSWVEGSAENTVINYIEDKYYKQRGVKLDFNVSYLGSDMHTKLETELAAGSQVDVVISHTSGGVGIDDKLRGENQHYNIVEAIQDYAPYVYDAVKGAPLDRMTTEDNDVIGIPSVISPYKFGILVRKDLMEKAGYTDDAAKAQTEYKNGQNYKLVDDLVTFKQMCLDIKAAESLTHAVTGAIWDLEKVLTLGAFADSGYFTNVLVKEGDKDYVRRGAATMEYQKVIATEYDWAVNGIISKDANSTMVQQAEQNFVSGKTAVFVQDPTIQHLIKVARMTKNNIPEAEFTVLGALTSGEIDPDTGLESTRKGFMRNASATFAAVIHASSTNAKDVLKFLNWVYSSEENYNLCRYGIEGTHWVNNGDGTYSYPQGKENYETSPAYSGILSFVENQNVSNLVYDGYSAEEKRWINEVAGNPDNYIKNDLIDYMFKGKANLNTKESTATGPLYSTVCDVWIGKTNPLAIQGNGKTLFENLINEYNGKILDVQEYYAQQYKYMKQLRENA